MDLGCGIGSTSAIWDPRTNLGERFFRLSKFRLEFSQRDPKVSTKFVVVLLENPLRCLIHFLAKSLRTRLNLIVQ